MNNSNQVAYLRNPLFDYTLIMGVCLLALTAGAVCLKNPALFPIVFFLDLWFLGYHHVVATFTRLAFDQKSVREHSFLVVWLPLIIIMGAVGATLMTGSWILATTYLYWQWFHYTRQSYGIARIYKRKNNPEDPATDQWVIYLLPLLGILYRSYQNPGAFLGMELRVLPVPFIVIKILSIITLISIIYWGAKQLRALKNGKSEWTYNLFIVSHLTIFYVGYLAIPDINLGWLVINIWHNAQYLLFVWFYNNKKFKSGVVPEHRLISWLSQDRHVIHYFLICFAISTFFYVTTSRLIGLITFTSLPLVVVFYQTINFHHYVVDGIIWKVRQKPLRNTLGIQ